MISQLFSAQQKKVHYFILDFDMLHKDFRMYVCIYMYIYVNIFFKQFLLIFLYSNKQFLSKKHVTLLILQTHAS